MHTYRKSRKGEVFSAPTATISDTPIAKTLGVSPQVYANAPKSKSRMGKPHTSTTPDRWESISHNPSGASNAPVNGRSLLDDILGGI